MSMEWLAVLGAAGRQYGRQPVNIALLLILPPLFAFALASSISTFSSVVGGNIGEGPAGGLGALWSAALLGGSASFFLIRASRQPDERLVLAGLESIHIAAAHAAGVAVLATVAGSAGFALVVVLNEVASPFDLWAAIVLGALAYEGMGIALAFFVHGDLEGSFVIILVFMLDAFVAGPVGGAEGPWPNVFPLHHPSQMVIDAVLNSDVDRTRYAWSAIYALAFLIAAGAAHRRRTL